MQSRAHKSAYYFAYVDICDFTLTHVSDVPHSVVAILSGVLAEWRKGNAVVQSEPTNLERLEELRHALGVLGNKSSARWRNLSWSEVGNAWSGPVDVVLCGLC